MTGWVRIVRSNLSLQSPKKAINECVQEQSALFHMGQKGAGFLLVTICEGAAQDDGRIQPPCTTPAELLSAFVQQGQKSSAVRQNKCCHWRLKDPPSEEEERGAEQPCDKCSQLAASLLAYSGSPSAL
ncbi:hypothetical protein Anapl_12126 [Anas platyrhynchos]|uniref:Uncharacterized protein n=1 Tax=Anas platyrhynchos TaxID=8839 RepID=R0LSP5_ANAPL|nr:hypothetical protein Anapl_12126 [Anas platyrhynchos]